MKANEQKRKSYYEELHNSHVNGMHSQFYNSNANSQMHHSDFEDVKSKSNYGGLTRNHSKDKQIDRLEEQLLEIEVKFQKAECQKYARLNMSVERAAQNNEKIKQKFVVRRTKQESMSYEMLKKVVEKRV